MILRAQIKPIIFGTKSKWTNFKAQNSRNFDGLNNMGYFKDPNSGNINKTSCFLK